MSTQKTPKDLYEMYKGRKATLYGGTGVVVGYDANEGYVEDPEQFGAPLIMGLLDTNADIAWDRDCMNSCDVIEVDCPYNHFLYIDVTDIIE